MQCGGVHLLAFRRPKSRSRKGIFEFSIILLGPSFKFRAFGQDSGTLYLEVVFGKCLPERVSNQQPLNIATFVVSVVQLRID